MDSKSSVKLAGQLQRALGANIRRTREQRGLTQEQAAAMAGLSVRHVQKIENGEVNLTIRTLARACIALGAEASELLRTADEPDRRKRG